jgi:photosystem II stability/assembly factor-like uncharacterized protein
MAGKVFAVPFVTMRIPIAFLLLVTMVPTARGQRWKPLGPPGGDVRALAADPARPSRLFLGTADGHIFGSEDSGANWTLLGRASSRLDAVITAIVVDPRDGNVLFASSWSRDSAAGGGVFRSGDGGRTWSLAGLAGQAVRALALAPSDPDMLVAGTLDGVYRSVDASRTWERISTEHDQELRNLDSLAVDPRDPQTIYAGTFHLPWKTVDGGRTWHPVHQGMIDDSDVMSLLIDGEDPRRIYASACSGIYRSDDAAVQWRKIQGIPYTARRTYGIAQDPKETARVYAATSEGLWKTSDGGMTWRRTTPDSWVVNTVVVAGGRPGRVLIGTEELGVLVSDDGGEHFQNSNAGFGHRQILALGMEAKQPGRILAALSHAPESILATDDEGKTWSALGPGLRADDALRIYAAPDGAWWVSRTRGGMLRYDAAGKTWKPAGVILGEAGEASEAVSHTGGRPVGKATMAPRPMTDVVTDLAFTSKKWYAATGRGLLVSLDRGATWRKEPVGPPASLPVQSVWASADGERLRVVSLRGLVFSEDGGTSWMWHDLPLESGGAVTLRALAGDDKTLVAIAREGLYISRDAGRTWQQAASGLPFTPVQDFASTGSVFVAAMRTGGLYVSRDSGRTWDRLPGTLADSYFAAVAPSSEPGAIFAASASEGLYKVEWSGAVSGNTISPGQSNAMLDGKSPRSGN